MGHYYSYYVAMPEISDEMRRSGNGLWNIFFPDVANNQEHELRNLTASA